MFKLDYEFVDGKCLVADKADIDGVSALIWIYDVTECPAGEFYRPINQTSGKAVCLEGRDYHVEVVANGAEHLLISTNFSIRDGKLSQVFPQAEEAAIRIMADMINDNGGETLSAFMMSRWQFETCLKKVMTSAGYVF